MARLPDIQEQPSPVPSPTGGVAGVQSSAGQGLGALAQTSKSMANDYGTVVDIVAATNARQDEQVAMDASNKLHEARIDLEYGDKVGFRNASGADAVGNAYIKKYGEGFGRSVTTLRDGLQNDHQRKIFDKHAEIHSLQFKSALMNHQAQETEKFNDGKDNSTIELQLREIALRGNDLSLENGMIAIDGTVDSFAKRKGLSAEATKVLKGKYRESAHTAQIMSILHGGPGRAPDPMAAQRKFEQVQEVFGELARIRLGADIMRAAKGVAESDTANRHLSGDRTLGVKELLPAVTGTRPLTQAIVPAVLYAENSARDAVSPKGAVSRMQVMKDTGADPGFGVRPAQAGADGTISIDEYERVGRDYAGAMASRYQDPVLALAAYNAGPGTVDKWVDKYGDPRKGEITHDEFVANIPFTETKNYVTRGMTKIDKGQFTTNDSSSKELKSDLYPRAKRAYDDWLGNNPNDVDGATRVQALVLNRGNLILQAQAAREQAAGESLINAVVGTKPDGSDAVKTPEQLMALPGMREAWATTTAPVRDQIQKRFSEGKKDLTPEGASLYNRVLGLAAEYPEVFADRTKTNLMTLFGRMPDNLWHELNTRQSALNKGQADEASRGEHYRRAFASTKDMLDPVLAAISNKERREKMQTTFNGRLTKEIDAEHGRTGKWPDHKRSQELAAGLLTTFKVRKEWWFDDTVVNFQAESMKDMYVPLPKHGSDEYRQEMEQYVRKHNKVPTDRELEEDLTKRVLAGDRPSWLR
jgi:hypothetical protein